MKIIPKNGLYLTNEDSQEHSKNQSVRSQNVRTSCKDCMLQCKSNMLLPTITFIVTENCNLNCSYCYEKHKTQKNMSQEVANKAVDFLFSDKIYPYFKKEDVDGFIIEFIGGEPLLMPELIDSVCLNFKEQCFNKNKTWLQNSMFNMSSNGTLYFDPKVQTLLDNHKGMMSLGITIDGDKKLHDSCRLYHDGRGSYDDVERSIKHWIKKSEELFPGTKVTIAPENVMYLSDAIKHLWENVGLKSIHANCVFEDVWEEKHEKIFYDELIKIADYLLDNELYSTYWVSLFDELIGKPDEDLDTNGCGGNGRMLAIGTDGALYPCLRFSGHALAKNKAYSIGDVTNGINIDDPWLKDLMKVTKRSSSPQKCLNCKIATGCGLCTGYHYDEYNDTNKRATNICGMHKARVEANKYYFNKLYKKLGLNKSF